MGVEAKIKIELLGKQKVKNISSAASRPRSKQLFKIRSAAPQY
jgi:hypothetical protein